MREHDLRVFFLGRIDVFALKAKTVFGREDEGMIAGVTAERESTFRIAPRRCARWAVAGLKRLDVGDRFSLAIDHSTLNRPERFQDDRLESPGILIELDPRGNPRREALGADDEAIVVALRQRFRSRERSRSTAMGIGPFSKPTTEYMLLV